MSQKLVITYVILAIIVLATGTYLITWFTSASSLGKTLAEFDSPTINSNVDSMEITFANKAYTVGFTGPAQESDFISDSREWVTGDETVENWTTLVTTHRLTPTSLTSLSAAVYAENVSALQAQNGALVLETSIINQDMEALGIDPNNPPYLLVYLYEQNGVTEFNMQKIVQLNEREVGSIIYAERFPTKSEPEMKEYYESKERTDKRIELIKLAFPY